jgi:hypothetical protein
MDKLHLSLVFDNTTTCQHFHRELSRAPLENDEFAIALPESGFNYDNAALSLLVDFYRHGGLQAVAALATLLKTILEKVAAKQKPPQPTRIQVIKNGRKAVIEGTMSIKETIEVLNALLSR